MATDKPLSENDDDIIELTDLVEEGSGGGDAGNDAPVDMSFEQELEDLFGDAEPAPAKSAAPAAVADDAGGDDAIDLTGLEVDETPETAPEKPSDDEDAIDLAGLGLDEGEEPADVEASAPNVGGDAMADLFGDDVAKAEGDDLLARFDAAKEPDAEATDTSALDAAPTQERADDSLDISDMALSALESETPSDMDADAAHSLEPSMDDLLGDLPPAPEAALAKDGGPDLAELDAIEDAPVVPAAAAATAATAGAIDLAALDKLIDTAKGPVPATPDKETADAGRIDVLTARIDTLETAAATLCDKVESLPTSADGDALADALSARLEDALTERLEAIMAGQPTPDHAALKAEILEAAEEQGAAARDALLAEVRQSLSRLESLTQEQQGQFTDFAATMETRLAEITRELPQPEAFATKDSLAASLETLGETLSRDIAGKLDERLTELRRELRETLSTELASALDERLTEAMESAKQAARQEVEALGAVLTGRIETLESERQDPEKFIAAVTDDVTGQVREALAPSFTALETKADRTDIDAAISSLREEMAADIKKLVPKAAAEVIREEITALAKELL